MAFALHTRAGLEPPYNSTQKRYLNTGSGGSGAGDGNIGEGVASTEIIIELETQLGEYVPSQGNNRNLLFASHINNTASAFESGIQRYDDGRIGISVGGNNRRLFSVDTYSDGDVLLIRLELNFPSTDSGITGNVDFYINGVLQGSRVARSDAFNGSSRWALNSHANNSHRSAENEYLTDQFVRRLYVNWVDANYERNWVFDQSSGFIVPDQLGSNDPIHLYGGNGQDNLGDSWPTDDSQWVPYGEPSDDIDATIAITMPQFSTAVSAATTAPGVSASVAFTMPQFTVLVDAEQQAPQYAASAALTMPQFTAAVTGEASAPTAGATVAFSMPQFVAAATADSTAPQYPAIAAFTMPQFMAAVQAEATAPGSGASVSFVMPQFTAAATAETTVPEFPAVAAFTMPQFGVAASAEASLPATGAVVSYTMPQFTVAASGASTVPTLTADVAYTMPQFGVMVLTDETPLGTAPGARLAWVAGSNKLAYNVGNNRLSWRA